MNRLERNGYLQAKRMNVLDLEMAAMQFDNGLCNRQPQTAPYGSGFGRKKRLENALEQVSRDARSLIADFDDCCHITRTEQVDFPASFVALDGDYRRQAGAYMDIPSLRHRLDRIHQDIDENLHELSLVGQHLRRGHHKVREKRDPCPHCLVLHQLNGLLHKCVDGHGSQHQVVLSVRSPACL